MNESFIYYHNPRCSKSREGLKIIEKNNINAKIKLYLSEEITFEAVIHDKLDAVAVDSRTRPQAYIIKKISMI